MRPRESAQPSSAPCWFSGLALAALAACSPRVNVGPTSDFDPCSAGGAGSSCGDASSHSADGAARDGRADGRSSADGVIAPDTSIGPGPALLFVSPLGDNTNLGTTSGQPLQTIGAAVGRRAAEIRVAEGIYRECLVIGYETRIHGGYSFDFSVKDWKQHPSLVDAQGLNCTAVDVRPKVIKTKVELSGFTFTNGSGFLALQNGGGVHSVHADLTLADCVMKNNSALSGGGLGIEGGIALVSRCQFTNNMALAGGGAIYLDGVSAKFEDCALTQNTSTATGGGYQIVNGSSTTITGGSINGNGTLEGGGIYIQDSTVVAKQLVISNNSAKKWNGGGILVKGGQAQLTLDGVSLEDHQSSALSIEKGKADLLNCSISKNLSLDYGGGLRASDAVVAIRSTTITLNEAQFAGGGLALDPFGGQGSYSIKDSTISGNYPDNVDGTYQDLGGNTIK
jgi:predicted outer membrane repeat protein